MIHFFCALHCEAEPIIKHYKLTEQKQYKLFRLYQSDNKSISLIITGIGKLNAASAVSFHHACLNTNPSDIWLNVGIAGHKNIDTGEICLIHKIKDADNNASWYPQILFKPPCPTATLITLPEASAEYQDDLFDMEASGFYEVAIRLGTAELIHSIKIVSDNPETPASTVKKDNVKQYISRHIDTLNKIIDKLLVLNSELELVNTEPDNFSSIVDRFHFTQSEKHQLKSLLRQFSIRLPDTNISRTVSKQNSGKDVLAKLRTTLNKSEYVIYD